MFTIQGLDQIQLLALRRRVELLVAQIPYHLLRLYFGNVEPRPLVLRRQESGARHSAVATWTEHDEPRQILVFRSNTIRDPSLDGRPVGQNAARLGEVTSLSVGRIKSVHRPYHA